MVFAAPARAGKGLFANAEFARADKQNISSRQTVSEKPNNHKKYTYSAKNALFQHFFFSFPQKKTTKIISKLLTRNKMQIIL